MYWIDGFIFNFVDGLIAPEESQQLNNSTVVKMELLESPTSKATKKHKQAIDISIKSNQSPHFLFLSIHQSVNKFVSQWIAASVGKGIRVKFKQNNREVENVDNMVFDVEKQNEECVYCGLKVPIGDNIKKCTKCEAMEPKLKAECKNCGHSLMITSSTRECENCTNKYFTIENQLAVLQGKISFFKGNQFYNFLG